MILLLPHSRFLLQTLVDRVHDIGAHIELNYYWIEFDDVRYHIQQVKKDSHFLMLSIALPPPPGKTILDGGLPSGALEAVRAAYGGIVEISEPPLEGFNLTLKLNLSKLPSIEEQRHTLLVKVSSLREVLLGAPLRVILKNLYLRIAGSDLNQLVAIVHRTNECYFVLPQREKVTVIFPVYFTDPIDIIYATSFLHEFVEARRAAALNAAPSCSWSPTPPPELKDAPPEAVSLANAGFMSFVILSRHVEGKRMDRIVWGVSTFHAFVSYHVKCSEGFIHTRMRRSVEAMIETLGRAKQVMKEDEDIPAQESGQCMEVEDVSHLDEEASHL